MARATIAPIKAAYRNDPSSAVDNTALFTAIDATDGAAISSWNESDEKYTIVIQNTSTTAAATVKILKGDGIHAVNDLTVSLAAGKTVCLSIDSARFKVLSGTDKGKILLTGPAAAKVAVFCTP